MKRCRYLLVLSFLLYMFVVHGMLPITIRTPVNEKTSDDVEYAWNGNTWMEIPKGKAKYNLATAEAEDNILPSYAYYGFTLSGIRQPLKNEKRFYGIDLSLYNDGVYQDDDSSALIKKRKFYGIIGAGVNLLGESDVYGIQLGGLSDCRRSIKGLQVGGLSLSKDVYGIQLSALGAIVGERIVGLQCAPLFNFCQWCDGIQLSTINISGVSGLQLGIINGSFLSMIQLGCLNLNIQDAGIQVGGINLSFDSESCAGPKTQLGIINCGFGGTRSRVQIGLINRTCELNGVQIGLLNFKDGSWVCPLFRISLK